jgi:2-methylcitrate dehydratase PrpD
MHLRTAAHGYVQFIAMAAGYEIKIEGADGEHPDHWCAAIDTVEHAVRAVCVVAKITDLRRLTVVGNLSQDDLRRLGLSAGGVQRIGRTPTQKRSI